MVRDGKSNFHAVSAKDIQFQIPTEYAIALEMARANAGLILPNQPGKNSTRDFRIWVPVDYEVKTDYKAKETRNAYFEVWNSIQNKPAGLKSTKADWWLHYIPGDATIYRFKPTTMLAWLEKLSGIQIFKNGGDKNANGYIVPLSTLSKLPFVKTHPFMG